ncbi:MAG TPA: HutD family protein, partial [Pseudomonadota bacterium]|nr:HutD family protein [Pseudomonadota bacterium]
TLIEGPCRDFNVIVDRQRARAEVRVISLSPPQPATLTASPQDDLWALFVLQGAATVSDPDQPPTSPPLSVQREHTLLCQGSEQAPLLRRLQVSAEGGETRLLWIAIRTPEATAADTGARP